MEDEARLVGVAGSNCRGLMGVASTRGSASIRFLKADTEKVQKGAEKCDAVARGTSSLAISHPPSKRGRFRRHTLAAALNGNATLP